MNLPAPNVEPANTGHGHVYPRPDGFKELCGGPALCIKCRLEAARKIVAADPHFNLQQHRKKIGDLHRASLARLMKMRPPNAIYSTDRIEHRRDDLKQYLGLLKQWHEEYVALCDFVNEEARDHGLAVGELGDVASLEAVFRDEILSPLSTAADKGD